MNKTGLILAALALAFTTACGSSSSDKKAESDRPTLSEVSKTLTTTSQAKPTALPKTQADCVAKLLVASDLPDKALKALVTNDAKYKPSANETKTLTAVGKTINTKCAA